MCVCLCVFACVCVFVQVCIATVCVRKDAGDRTAPTAAPVRTEAPAPRRTAPACARRDTEAPTADGVKKHNNTQHTHTLTRTGIFIENLCMCLLEFDEVRRWRQAL